MFHLTGRARGEGGMCHIGSSMAVGGWGVRGGLQRQISRVRTPSLSLSLSTSGEDFAVLWQRRRTHFGLEATGAKNT